LFVIGATWHHIPEDGIFFCSDCCENFQSYKIVEFDGWEVELRWHVHSYFTVSKCSMCRRSSSHLKQLHCDICFFLGNWRYIMKIKKQRQTLWPLVRKRTLPTERPPLVDEI
jgi:hypothetical protein